MKNVGNIKMLSCILLASFLAPAAFGQARGRGSRAREIIRSPGGSLAPSGVRATAHRYDPVRSRTLSQGDITAPGMETGVGAGASTSRAATFRPSAEAKSPFETSSREKSEAEVALEIAAIEARNDTSVEGKVNLELLTAHNEAVAGARGPEVRDLTIITKQVQESNCNPCKTNLATALEMTARTKGNETSLIKAFERSLTTLGIEMDKVRKECLNG